MDYLSHLSDNRKQLSFWFSFPMLSSGVLLIFISAVVVSAEDLRGKIKRGMEPCFHYTPHRYLFQMNCTVLNWREHGYSNHTHISLHANEIFDGGATDKGSIGSIIDLSGVVGFQGLLAITDGNISSLANAPLIRNVHVRNGTTSREGGFIVRRNQQYFVVDSCSSTGDITGWGAGGICGYRCGGSNGQIEVFDSYSMGKLMGPYAGGITGREVARNGGIVNITQCYSTGNIEHSWAAGGICGADAGSADGELYVTQSYSTGDIISAASGGIVGSGAGGHGGYVHIKESYSTGAIAARWAGGITGSAAARSEGEVHITDCYTRGYIDGEKTGGVTGFNTGGCCSASQDFGNVYIKNTYSAGQIITHENGSETGGIIGHINPEFRGHTIRIQHSVYNGKSDGSVIIGQGPTNNVVETGISDNLKDIRGQLYHYQSKTQWDGDIWRVCELPILHFQGECPGPSPSATCTATSSVTTITSSSTYSPSRWSTSSPSASRVPLPSSSPSSSSPRRPFGRRILPLQLPPRSVRQLPRKRKKRPKR